MEFKVYDSPKKGYHFTDALIELRGHKCERCNNTTWLGFPIKLEVHHINGNKCDCTKENLQLLCPNCHAYTDNFGTKNLKQSYITDAEILAAIPNNDNIRQLLLSLGMSDAGANYARVRELLANNSEVHFITKSENKCPICGQLISTAAKYCSRCFSQNRRTVERPSREELKDMIRNRTFVSIAAEYGVSDNAIRKWCDAYSLPKKKADIKKYTNEQWEVL